ncbi:hypothetical protein [Pedobacter rhizosphaerae]|nr:hypothetical protein [Pedobacter rhizosphaerae]
MRKKEQGARNKEQGAKSEEEKGEILAGRSGIQKLINMNRAKKEF